MSACHAVKHCLGLVIQLFNAICALKRGLEYVAWFFNFYLAQTG